MFGHLEAPTQHGEIFIAQCRVFAKASHQRLLEVLSVIQIVQVALLGGNVALLGDNVRAQPLKLSFVVSGGVITHAKFGDALWLSASRVPGTSSRMAAGVSMGSSPGSLPVGHGPLSRVAGMVGEHEHSPRPAGTARSRSSPCSSAGEPIVSNAV
jgi:hypothetical protein